MLPGNIISALFNLSQLVVIPTTDIAQLQTSSTVLLIKASGINGSTNSVILDSSPTAATVTRFGSVTQGSFSPFSPTGWSARFNGSTSFLHIAAHPSLAVGVSDFTFEAWVNISTLPTDPTHGRVIGGDILWQAGYQGGWYVSITSLMGIRYNYSGSSGSWIATETTGNNLQINSWRHVAVSRSAGVSKVFLDGVLILTANNAENYTAGRVFRVGGLIGDGTVYGYFAGSISNLRLVNGTALYTQNFVPPVLELQPIANTALLILQDNRFKDNSVNAHIVGGVLPPIQPISPFQQSVYYSPALHGGSLYFSGGAANYLSIPAASSVKFGTDSFTLEGWLYKISNSTAQSIFAGGPNTAAGFGLAFYGNTDRIGLIHAGTGTVIVQDTSAFPLQQWVHFALVRSNSSTLTLYVNGVAKASTQWTGDWNGTGSTASFIGLWVDGTSFSYSGYISNLRAVKGSALYSANFTPPQAPITAVSGTSLLLLGANANITDLMSKSNLLTVGTSQVSTAVKKYNSASMRFNGAGTDYVSMVNGEQFDLSKGDFTIEAWVNITNLSTFRGICGARATGAGSGWCLYIHSNGTLYTGSLIVGNSYTDRQIHPTIIGISTWNHIALVKSAAGYTAFVNGIPGPRLALTGGLDYQRAQPLAVGALSSTGEYPFVGYIEDFRITQAIVYVSGFTPPIVEFPELPGDDPHSSKVQLLLQGNTLNSLVNNNTILDSSASPFTLTRSSTFVGQGRVSPFSTRGWGIYSPAGSSLKTPSGPEFNLPGAFTVETWINPVSSAFEIYGAGANGVVGQMEWSFRQYSSSWGICFYVASLVSPGSPSPVTAIYTGIYAPLNEWSHLAVTRDSSNVWRIFLNGISLTTYVSNQNATWNPSANLTNNVGVTICNPSNPAYFSNFRVVKGVSVYVTDFVQSAVPITAISGTSLLLFNNRILRDYSPNNFSLTVTGAPLVKQISPFAAVAYSKEIHGGSLSFLEGSSVATSTPVAAIGTQDFTIETWLFADQSTGAYSNIFIIGTTLGMRFSDSGYGYKFQVGHFVTSSTLYSCALTSANFVNRWTHIAFTRQSGVYRLFINGDIASINNGVNPSTYPLTSWTDSTPIASGVISVGNLGINGLQSNTRLVVGTALYTASFPVPDAPATAVSGTKLLLSGTNSGFIDLASNSDISTIGTAVLSTAQKKFGTSSMYFDGSAQSYIKLSPGALNFSLYDFTIEFWYYRTSASNNMARLFQTTDGEGITGISIMDNAGGNLFVAASSNGTGWDIIPSTQVGSITLATWNHIALRRVGPTFTVFLNGVQFPTTFSSTSSVHFNPAHTPVIGGQSTPARSIFGYIDDLRVTIGKGRYTVEPISAL